MEHSICSKDPESIVREIQDYIEKSGMVKGIVVIDSTEDQVILLLDSSDMIDERIVAAWRSGWKAASGE